MNFHFNFHGCPPGKGYFSVKKHQVTNMNRVTKNHLVDRHSYRPVGRVTGGCQRPSLVNQFHDPTTVDISLCVSVFRHHDLCQLNARGAHRFWVVDLIHNFLIQVLPHFSSIQSMQAFRFIKEYIKYSETKVAHQRSQGYRSRNSQPLLRCRRSSTRFEGGGNTLSNNTWLSR